MGLTVDNLSHEPCILECGSDDVRNAGVGCGCRAFTCLSGLLYRADPPGVHVCPLLPPSHEVSQVCQISPTGKAGQAAAGAVLHAWTPLQSTYLEEPSVYLHDVSWLHACSALVLLSAKLSCPA